MKKLIAVVLALALLLPGFGGLELKTHAAGVSMNTSNIKPFTLVNWDAPDTPIANVYGMPQFIADGKSMAQHNDWTMTWSARGNIQNEAKKLKAYMDNVPEGSRFIYVATYSTFVVLSEDVVYHDAGVAKLRIWLIQFLSYYKSIGGKLDGIALDTEYDLDSISNIDSQKYNEVVAKSSYGIPDKYGKVDAAGMLMRIQNNSKYPKLRKLLAEQGFVFYSRTDKSELSYMLDKNSANYSYNRSVWNKAIRILKTQYLQEAIVDPLLLYYPDALVGDYDFTNTYSWLKTSDTHGYYKNVTGNAVEIGNTSNLYTYAQRPSKWFYAGNDGAYPPGYNKATYEDTAFGAFLYDMKVFKDMQAAVDEDGNLNAWVTFYDYNYKTNTSGYAANIVSGTPYHTETLYHIGLMNPKPFLGYVYKNDIKYDEACRRLIAAGKTVNTANLNTVYAELTSSVISKMYQERLQNLADIMAELTRVAGAADRKPIPYASSWNSSFVISGMYAGGRNIWRISPDTTKGISLAEFKVKDKAPTFRINGQTVIFPQGRIIQESKIEPYGSCGYWVETPANVEPVVINDEDRHSKYPAYGEAFSAALNTKFWKTTGTATVKNGALTLSNGATVKNVTIPKQITAGDNYAKQQAWEITVTLPSSLSSTEVMLLSCGTNDGFRVKSGNLQYSQAGTYKDLASLSAGGKYTVKREVDFTAAGAYKSSFYVYNASGDLIAQQTNVPMSNLTLPVTTISFSAKTASGQTVRLDDYKLYPMGVTTDFELYDAKTGYKVTGTTNAGATAYRLSWMNASDTTKKATIVAEFYNGSTRVSTKTVREITMSPGADGVETEIVPLSAGTSVKLTLQTAGSADVVWPDYDNDNFNWTVTGGSQGGTNTGGSQGGTNTGGSQGGTNTGGSQGGTNTGGSQGGTNTGGSQGGGNTGTNQDGQNDNTEETTLPDNTTGETTLPDNTTGETTLPDNTTGETTLPDNTTGETILPDNTVDTPDAPEPDVKKGLHGGWIALIVIGSVIVAVAVAFGILFLVKKETTIPWIMETVKRIFKK